MSLARAVGITQSAGNVSLRIENELPNHQVTISRTGTVPPAAGTIVVSGIAPQSSDAHLLAGDIDVTVAVVDVNYYTGRFDQLLFDVSTLSIGTTIDIEVASWR